MATMVANTP